MSVSLACSVSSCCCVLKEAFATPSRTEQTSLYACMLICVSVGKFCTQIMQAMIQIEQQKYGE